MFTDLLGPGYEVEAFDVQTGKFPRPAAHGAYLITGSPAGVYDPLPWIPPLMEFIRNSKDAKLIGDIKTARIVIEDGAYFKGSIDIVKTDAPKQAQPRPQAAAASASQPNAVPQNAVR